MLDLIRRLDALIEQHLVAEVLPDDGVLDAAARDVALAFTVKIAEQLDPMEAVELVRLQTARSHEVEREEQVDVHPRAKLPTTPPSPRYYTRKPGSAYVTRRRF